MRGPHCLHHKSSWFIYVETEKWTVAPGIVCTCYNVKTVKLPQGANATMILPPETYTSEVETRVSRVMWNYCIVHNCKDRVTSIECDIHNTEDMWLRLSTLMAEEVTDKDVRRFIPKDTIIGINSILSRRYDIRDIVRSDSMFTTKIDGKLVPTRTTIWPCRVNKVNSTLLMNMLYILLLYMLSLDILPQRNTSCMLIPSLDIALPLFIQRFKPRTVEKLRLKFLLLALRPVSVDIKLEQQQLAGIVRPNPQRCWKSGHGHGRGHGYPSRYTQPYI